MTLCSFTSRVWTKVHNASVNEVMRRLTNISLDRLHCEILSHRLLSLSHSYEYHRLRRVLLRLFGSCDSLFWVLVSQIRTDTVSQDAGCASAASWLIYVNYLCGDSRTLKSLTRPSESVLQDNSESRRFLLKRKKIYVSKIL